MALTKRAVEIGWMFDGEYQPYLAHTLSPTPFRLLFLHYSLQLVQNEDTVF